METSDLELARKWLALKEATEKKSAADGWVLTAKGYGRGITAYDGFLSWSACVNDAFVYDTLEAARQSDGWRIKMDDKEVMRLEEYKQKLVERAFLNSMPLW